MLKQMKSSLFVRIFAVITASISVLFCVMYLQVVPYIQITVATIEERSGRTILDSVYETVQTIYADLENSRLVVLQERKASLRNIIDIATARAGVLDGLVQAKKLSRSQARQEFLDEIRRMSYGHDDYVFASDYRSVLVSHPDPALNNADFSHVLDEHGALIVPPMVAGALHDGDGYYSYWWRRLGKQEPIEKLTYYRNIPAFGLVIGSGVYLDDIESYMNTKREQAIRNLRARLLETHLAETGYLYIFTEDESMLIHPNANMEGIDGSKLIEKKTGKPFLKMLKDIADKPVALHYKWDKPSDPGHYVYDKISWVRYFVGYDWYIGSSIYVDELEKSARVLRNRVLMVFTLTLLVSIILIYLLVKTLTNPLRHISATALRVEAGDLNARCNISRKDEIGIVAAAFDGMVVKLQDNIRHLDDKVMQRTIALERANEELQALDRLKSDFLSTVSHELRTPMTSVIGFAKLVKKKLDNVIFAEMVPDAKTARAIEQVRQNLNIIVSESERLTHLINDVLDSAKLEAGKVEWNLVPLSPLHLIDRTICVTNVLIEQNGLRSSVDVEPDLPMILGDENHLIQVLINLVGNAVKFTQQGQIDLRASRQGQFVCFSVRDNGHGIAPQDQARVFEKFTQISDTLTDKPPGTGLGLSICQRIVEYHGGKIWLESALGQGSTFFFTVPVVTEDGV